MLPRSSFFNTALIIHCLGGGMIVLGLIALVVVQMLPPRDQFVLTHYSLVGKIQYALAGLMYYGFAGALLFLLPLPARWGVAYTLMSWLSFLWAFAPAQPAGGAPGMMRRIASPENYLAMQQAGQHWHFIAVAVFALLQIAYLTYVVRRLRSGSTNTG